MCVSRSFAVAASGFAIIGNIAITDSVKAGEGFQSKENTACTFILSGADERILGGKVSISPGPEGEFSCTSGNISWKISGDYFKPGVPDSVFDPNGHRLELFHANVTISDPETNLNATIGMLGNQSVPFGFHPRTIYTDELPFVKTAALNQTGLALSQQVGGLFWQARISQHVGELNGSVINVPEDMSISFGASYILNEAFKVGAYYSQPRGFNDNDTVSFFGNYIGSEVNGVSISGALNHIIDSKSQLTSGQVAVNFNLDDMFSVESSNGIFSNWNAHIATGFNCANDTLGTACDGSVQGGLEKKINLSGDTSLTFHGTIGATDFANDNKGWTAEHSFGFRLQQKF